MAALCTTPALAADLQFKRKSSVSKLAECNGVRLSHSAPHKTTPPSATVSGAPRGCRNMKLLTDSLLVPFSKLAEIECHTSAHAAI